MLTGGPAAGGTGGTASVWALSMDWEGGSRTPSWWPCAVNHLWAPVRIWAAGQPTATHLRHPLAAAGCAYEQIAAQSPGPNASSAVEPVRWRRAGHEGPDTPRHCSAPALGLAAARSSAERPVGPLQVLPPSCRCCESGESEPAWGWPVARLDEHLCAPQEASPSLSSGIPAHVYQLPPRIPCASASLCTRSSGRLRRGSQRFALRPVTRPGLPLRDPELRAGHSTERHTPDAIGQPAAVLPGVGVAGASRGCGATAYVAHARAMPPRRDQQPPAATTATAAVRGRTTRHHLSDLAAAGGEQPARDRPRAIARRTERGAGAARPPGRRAHTIKRAVALLGCKLRWPDGACPEPTPDPELALADSVEQLHQLALSRFSIDDPDQLNDIVVSGVGFVEVWPAAHTAVRRAVGILLAEAPRLPGASQTCRLRQCLVCGSWVSNMGPHLRRHIEIGYLCAEPGCGRVFNYSRPGLLTHAKAHALAAAEPHPSVPTPASQHIDPPQCA